jgi:hypothetical protein
MALGGKRHPALLSAVDGIEGVSGQRLNALRQIPRRKIGGETPVFGVAQFVSFGPRRPKMLYLQ